MPIVWIVAAVAAYFWWSTEKAPQAASGQPTTDKPGVQNGSLSIGPVSNIPVKTASYQRDSTPLDVADSGLSVDYVNQIMNPNPPADYVSVSNNTTPSTTPADYVSLPTETDPTNSDLGPAVSLEGYTS